MSVTLSESERLKNGVLGNYSGTINGVVLQKNGVIRTNKLSIKKKRRKKNEIS